MDLEILDTLCVSHVNARFYCESFVLDFAAKLRRMDVYIRSYVGRKMLAHKSIIQHVCDDNNDYDDKSDVEDSKEMKIPKKM